MADIIQFPKHHPLLQPVTWQQRQYFTSYVLHQEYLHNAGLKGKYQQHKSFLRLLRSIEAYPLYVDQGDIVELAWSQVKSQAPNLCLALRPLFEATNYHPVILINAPAQLALHQHLDDELSQQIAYTTNQAAARKRDASPVLPTPEETAVRVLKAWQQAGELLKTPPHITNQEAAKAARLATGVDFTPLIAASTTQDDIADEAMMLEPRDLGRLLKIGDSGAEMNRLLASWGWQTKTPLGWEPTALGRPYAAKHAFVAQHGHKAGYNWRWNVAAVRSRLSRASEVPHA